MHLEEPAREALLDVRVAPPAEEEHQATGLGDSKNDPITENKYREQRRALAGLKGSLPSDSTDMIPRAAYHTMYPANLRCPTVR